MRLRTKREARRAGGAGARTLGAARPRAAGALRGPALSAPGARRDPPRVNFLYQELLCQDLAGAEFLEGSLTLGNSTPWR